MKEETDELVKAAKPIDYTCRKHGNIGQNYFTVGTNLLMDAETGRRKVAATFHCLFCYREAMDKVCERAIPVGVPPGPVVGG